MSAASSRLQLCIPHIDKQWANFYAKDLSLNAERQRLRYAWVIRLQKPATWSRLPHYELKLIFHIQENDYEHVALKSLKITLMYNDFDKKDYVLIKRIVK